MKKITTLLLIRHGQTDWNAERRWQGHHDQPLNAEGTAQANAIAARLASYTVDAIYSSDLQRAASTAVPIAAALNLPLIKEPLLRERDVGVFGGLTRDQIMEQYPNIWAEARNGILNPPEGEHNLHFRSRCEKAFNTLVERHPGQTIVAVSHGGVLYGIISYVLGLHPDQIGRFGFENTSLNIVQVNEHGPRLARMNDIYHLTGK